MKMIVKMMRTHMVLQRMTLLLHFHNHQEAFNGYGIIEEKDASTLAKIE